MDNMMTLVTADSYLFERVWNAFSQDENTGMDGQFNQFKEDLLDGVVDLEDWQDLLAKDATIHFRVNGVGRWATITKGDCSIAIVKEEQIYLEVCAANFHSQISSILNEIGITEEHPVVGRTFVRF